MGLKIKICGVRRAEDIAAVNAAMPDYVGFVFVPASRRYVADRAAYSLRGGLKEGILPVGVFADESVGRVCEIAKEGIISLIQLHGEESEEYMERVKERTGLPVIKAISMTCGSAGESLERWERSCADYLLLDSGRGGTGKPFDYGILKRKPQKPFFLAGGLTAESIPQAAAAMKPYAVDLSGGVESGGAKDPEKIMKAVCAARSVL